MIEREADGVIHGAPTRPVGAGVVGAAGSAAADPPADAGADRPSAPHDGSTPTGGEPSRPCPWCAAPTAGGDRFCETCGVRLRGGRCGTTPARRAAAARRAACCPHCGAPVGPDGLDADLWCASCGRRRPDEFEHVVVTADGAAAMSDRGHVRSRNEDAVALGPEGAADGTAAPVAAVVCDGVSSVPFSDVAARLAAAAALERLLRDPAQAVSTDEDGAVVPSDGDGRVRAAVAAGAAVTDDLPAWLLTGSAPSCTLVCGFVDPCTATVTVGWVGDSRAYWLGADGESQLLTRDHVAAAAPPGTVDPVVAALRPDALTRWLGAGGEPEPDLVTLTPSGPGALLLCTDGLWKYLPDAGELAAVALAPLRDGGPLAAAAALVDAALAAGGEDNVTVALIPVPVPQRSTP